MEVFPVLLLSSSLNQFQALHNSLHFTLQLLSSLSVHSSHKHLLSSPSSTPSCSLCLSVSLSPIFGACPSEKRVSPLGSGPRYLGTSLHQRNYGLKISSQQPWLAAKSVHQTSSSSSCSSTPKLSRVFPLLFLTPYVGLSKQNRSPFQPAKSICYRDRKIITDGWSCRSFCALHANFFSSICSSKPHMKHEPAMWGSRQKSQGLFEWQQYCNTEIPQEVTALL